jgi:hypothetical protein
MGIMDSLKGLLGKGKDYAAQNPDKVQGYIDKAGDTVDGKTGGKYSQHVDKAQDAAKKHLGGSGGDGAPGQGAGNPPPQPPQ